MLPLTVQNLLFYLRSGIRSKELTTNPSLLLNIYSIIYAQVFVLRN